MKWLVLIKITLVSFLTCQAECLKATSERTPEEKLALELAQELELLKKPTLPFTVPACGAPVERPNIHSMDRAALQVFFNGMKQIRSYPHPNQYDELVLIHRKYFDLVHNSTQFLAWHRVFTFQLELLLREVNDTIRIPYWDWTVYSQVVGDDPVFSNGMFGGQGKLGTETTPPDQPEWGCIQDGQFKDSFGYYVAKKRGEDKPHCIHRGSEFFKKALACPQILDLDLLPNSNITQFAVEFEAGAHNIVHDLIGAEFGVHVSANDPLFFVHHAFVDKVWFDWQQIHNKIEYPGDNTVLAPWNVTAAEVANLQNLCLTYEQEHFKWSNRNPFNPKRREAMKLKHDLFMLDPNLPTTNFTAAHYQFDPLFRTDLLGSVNSHQLAIPPPLSDRIINQNHLNRTLVRELEMRYSLLITELNQINGFESEASPSNILSIHPSPPGPY